MNMKGTYAEKGARSNDKIIFLLKCLLFSYIMTAGLLLLLALFLYRFHLQEKIVSISIIAIYILVTFVAGFISGKKMGSRKFVWGLIMGIMYFAVLAIVSLVINKSLQDVASNFVTVFLLCGGSGMLGGMIS